MSAPVPRFPHVPLSRVFGYDRGKQSIARYYIDSFIAQNSGDIGGAVLEIGDDRYTSRHRTDRVRRSDVLHAGDGGPEGALIGDLTDPASLPRRQYDCIIATQTLQMIYRCETALINAARLLAPGGVILATLSGISQISRYDMERWGEYWRFTQASARRMFEAAFAPGDISIRAYGNVGAAAALLYGLASAELTPEDLDSQDEDYPVVIGVRAVSRVDSGPPGAAAEGNDSEKS